MSEFYFNLEKVCLLTSYSSAEISLSKTNFRLSKTLVTGKKPKQEVAMMLPLNTPSFPHIQALKQHPDPHTHSHACTHASYQHLLHSHITELTYLTKYLLFLARHKLHELSQELEHTAGAQ